MKTDGYGVVLNNLSHTKAGPGRFSICNVKVYQPNPAGTKLVKRFIKQAKGEAHAYRVHLQELLS